jgi:hypothetical protein
MGSFQTSQNLSFVCTWGAKRKAQCLDSDLTAAGVASAAAIAISVPNSTESRFQTGYRFTLAARAGGFPLDGRSIVQQARAKPFKHKRVMR